MSSAEGGLTATIAFSPVVVTRVARVQPDLNAPDAWSTILGLDPLDDALEFPRDVWNGQVVELAALADELANPQVFIPARGIGPYPVRASSPVEGGRVAFAPRPVDSITANEGAPLLGTQLLSVPGQSAAYVQRLAAIVSGDPPVSADQVLGATYALAIYEVLASIRREGRVQAAARSGGALPAALAVVFVCGLAWQALVYQVGQVELARARAFELEQVRNAAREASARLAQVRAGNSLPAEGPAEQAARETINRLASAGATRAREAPSDLVTDRGRTWRGSGSSLSLLPMALLAGGIYFLAQGSDE